MTAARPTGGVRRRACARARPTGGFRRRGFTLLEVMVAVAILVVIGTVVMTTVRNTLKARDLLAAGDTANQAARVALSRLGRELQLAYLTSHTTAVNTYRTVFVSRNEDPADSLWFATLAHRRLYANSHECDQAEVTLWPEDDPESRGLLVLLHRESLRIDEKPDEGGTILPLAHGVRRFDLRFLDSKTGEWKEEWSSTGTETPERLPRAVKIVLVLATPDPEDEDVLEDSSWVTTVLLEYAAPMTRSLFSQDGQGVSNE